MVLERRIVIGIVKKSMVSGRATDARGEGEMVRTVDDRVVRTV